jgi:hypothetical protein
LAHIAWNNSLTWVADEGTSGNDFSSPPQILGEIGITELLEQDSRPTFILDLQASEKEIKGRLNVVWVNKSLKFFEFVSYTLDPTHVDFDTVHFDK